jgi:hypothetical protein
MHYRRSTMKDLHLDKSEEQFLKHLLERTLADLKYEIGRTDKYEFRSELKDQGGLIIKLLDDLKENGKK